MRMDDILVIATLHISSGSFQMTVKSDKTATAEIFGKLITLKMINNKIEISDKFSASQFKGGAEERDELIKWLKQTMKEALT